MYDSDFTLVKTFTDHTLRDSYAPFGIQTIGGKLFVTYAKLDSKKHDDVGGPGNGFFKRQCRQQFAPFEKRPVGSETVLKSCSTHTCSKHEKEF